ncbi:F-box protein At1g47056-like [Ananas comosus]|uniref:F-box protein At1g47056-like n=1 Tax=Ananas comosus TaxID=4615 RepID=A0A6P5EJH4_ANACO|nr:F-box protein At1g47056-like [Ananas comosus]
MGQSVSSLSRFQSRSESRSRSLSEALFSESQSRSQSLRRRSGACSSSSMRGVPSSDRRDHTLELPDECLALIFSSLSPSDRKRCSLVCRRWLAVEGQSRHRLSLDARKDLLSFAPALLSRFDSVTKLALKCDRRSESIGDDALALISSRLPRLSRLKLRACRQLTDLGMSALAANCPDLRKLSCSSCAFGPKAVDAVLRACPLLEDLSLKRLRGLSDPTAASDLLLLLAPCSSSSLRSICLKELYNAQCFAPLIAGSPHLRSLKVLRCSGDWDLLLEEITSRVPSVADVHLEKLQVGDRGLFALSACADLEVLHLVKTPECTDAGLAAVADGCRRLRKLHLDGWRSNRIGDLGLSAVARGCPELQELVLIGINPTALSLGLLAGCCRTLERLALCGCETVGDAEIACLAARCLSLKKLCIKGCPLSDRGMEALARGCPNLVKVKLKRCRSVTPECVEWLKAVRGESFAISLDAAEQQEQDAVSASESGVQDTAAEQIPELIDQFAAVDLPSSSSSRSALSKSRMRHFMVSAFRRWSSGSGNPPSS